MNKILIFRDFREDRRLSMELYADKLASSLRILEKENIYFSEYSPNIPKWGQGVNGLRFSRYILYPFQILGKNASVFHIIDQAYGHLTYFLNPKKCIITVHDMITVLRWKGMLQGLDRDHFPILALFSLNSVKRAHHLIAVSNNTKNDLIKLLGINPNRISVIYSGIDQIFKQYDSKNKKAVRENMFKSDNSNKLILTTGSQYYKNHETVLKTISFLQTIGIDNIKLIKTGPITNEWRKLVQSYDLEKEVINLGVIKRNALPDLYNAVDLLMYPSIYEGFGWPPLESMACGTPVVASNSASLPEVIGEGGIMHDPYDYKSFAATIKRLFSDEGYYLNFVERGLNQAKKFDWNDTAKQIIKIYENIISMN